MAYAEGQRAARSGETRRAPYIFASSGVLEELWLLGYDETLDGEKEARPCPAR